MLEKRGRKAAQRALRELTNNTSHVSTAAANTSVNTTETSSRTATAACAKRRATNHHYGSTNTTASAMPRRTPLGGVSGNGAVSGGGGDARGVGLGLSTSRDAAAVRGSRIGEIGREEEDGDAVWLREAEALLSRCDQPGVRL